MVDEAAGRVPIAMGGPGGPVMDAPEAFGTVYDPIETLSYVAEIPVGGVPRPWRA